MSDHWTILIPDAPDYVPSAETQRQAVALFKEIAPNAADVRAEVSDDVRFIDCGSNFERIVCPDCGAEIELDWWTEQMDTESKNGCQLRPVELACCKARRNLNELSYEWPQGFARFSLEAMNANIGDVPDEKKAAFERILGCSVRKIFRHL